MDPATPPRPAAPLAARGGGLLLLRARVATMNHDAAFFFII
jgi:hypothetical protein